jgi:GST-like protein
MAYESGEFLDVQSYKNVQRWTAQIGGRQAVKRGQIVNRALPERHDAADIDKALEEAAKAKAAK